jgi:uncharacterized DUF497 family protein
VYEWDETKSQAIISKHALSFEDASILFPGPRVTFEDTRHDYDERRFITLGPLAGRVVVIAHTSRDETTRVISMRKANSREQEIYYQKRLETD